MAQTWNLFFTGLPSPIIRPQGRSKGKARKLCSKQTLADDLLEWYDAHQRDLPWRAKPGEQSDPYQVWLSEVMLQQTTVATVKGYYQRFLDRWPDVHALANARQEDVLEEWAGLGYYARARNLHACAQMVSNVHAGKFPNTANTLQTLPGIGDYASAAIAAIAYGEPVPVIDGNVERIIARLYEINAPLPKGRKTILQALAPLVPRRRPGDFAQATMDLGATICRPKNPACGVCPMMNHCAARQSNSQEAFPVKLVKKTKPTRRIVAFALIHDGHILLERRPETGLLGGTLGLPSTPWVARQDFPSNKEWIEAAPVSSHWKDAPAPKRHTFTHFHLDAQLKLGITQNRANIENCEWIALTPTLAEKLPTVFAKMLQALALKE